MAWMSSVQDVLEACCDWVLQASHALASCWTGLETCFLQVLLKAFVDFQEACQAFDDSFLVLQVALAVLQEVDLGQGPCHDQVLQTACQIHLGASLGLQACLVHLVAYQNHSEAFQEPEVLQAAFHVLQEASQNFQVACQDLQIAFRVLLQAAFLQVLHQAAFLQVLQDLLQVAFRVLQDPPLEAFLQDHV